MLYDEQIGMTFTQNFVSLAYNVTAVAQFEQSSGYGPAYLLNGLSNSGYWYQVGIAYNWPTDRGYEPGFNMIYEVWDPSGRSIYPSSGGAGLMKFSGPVHAGDTVLLNLYFSSTYGVVMLAKDFNTSSTAYQTYSSAGGSYFIGLNTATADHNGYFTGLMTEWYHSSPFYNNTNPVVYSNFHNPLKSAWMWIDEFSCSDANCSSIAVLFSDSTPGPVSYSNPIQLHKFSSHGATAFSNAYKFITGPAYVSLTLSYEVVGGGSGYSAPTLTYTYNGTRKTTTLSTIQKEYIMDAVSPWSVSSILQGSTANERWKTNQPTDGTASSPQTLRLSYYHQYLVMFSYSVVGGGSGYKPPVVQYMQFGTSQVSQPAAIWADSNSSYIYQQQLEGSTTVERWYTRSYVGYIISPSTVSAIYYHQYLMTFSYSIKGGTNPTTPAIISLEFGKPISVNLTKAPTGIWLDSGSEWKVASNPLASSNSTSRWYASTSSGTVSGPNNISIVYMLQFLLQVTGAKTFSEWYDSGSVVNYTTQEVFGRENGTGYRIALYRLDNGAQTPLQPTKGNITIVVIMNKWHVLELIPIVQYQLTLNPTAISSLSSISPPTINGDNGWYDKGTEVSISFNYVWNVTTHKSRLLATSYSIDKQNIAALPERDNGTFNISLVMNSPHIVEVKSVLQYYVLFRFTDALGIKIISPEEVQILVNNQTKDIQGQNIWLNNGTSFIISRLMYEGVDVNPEKVWYTVTGPSEVQVEAFVYDAKLSVSDFFGFPVSGAEVKVTLANGSVISGSTGSNGSFIMHNIPLGKFNGSISFLGFKEQVQGNASEQKIAIVSVPLSFISLSVIFLIVVAIIGTTIFLLPKKRKTSSR
jgi:hypothetical protein